MDKKTVLYITGVSIIVVAIITVVVLSREHYNPEPASIFVPVLPTVTKIDGSGMYARISGDVAQPAYIKKEKYNGKNPPRLIYYNEKHEIIDSSIRKKHHNASEYNTQRSSNSKCTDINHTYSECNGYGENKFGRRNVKFTSFHTYNVVDGVVYCTHLYVFDNGDASTAVYKQISK